LHTNIILNGGSVSTLINYGRSLAYMALYFKTCPTTIADDRINDYLLLLQEKKNPSASYFKHTVYGLRLAFRLIDREDRAIRLPSIRRSKSLPVILNRKEVKALIGAPKWKKHEKKSKL